MTVPYISQIWKKYCDLTHQPFPTHTPTPTQSTHSYTPQLTIISGNNGSISTTTVYDHPPSAYTRKRRKHTNTYPHHYTQQLILQNSPLPQSTISLNTSIHPNTSSNTPPSHTQTNNKSAPSPEWSLPSHPIRSLTQPNTPSIPNTHPDVHNNTFSVLSVEEIYTPEIHSPLELPPLQTFSTIILNLLQRSLNTFK